MRWPRFAAAFLLRALVRELRGIHQQLVRQTDLLERWSAAAGVPSQSVTAASADLQDTGISFLDPIERGIVEDYIGKTHNATGRDPTEDEILVYLADEKTVSLHERLQQRQAEADLDRLRRSR